jgi:hypothetical protein
VQLVGQGHEVDGLLAFAKRNHVGKDATVLIKEKIFGSQRFDGGVQRVVVEQNGAEYGALGFEIIRQRLFKGGVSCHGEIRWLIRFLFAYHWTTLFLRVQVHSHRGYLTIFRWRGLRFYQ